MGNRRCQFNMSHTLSADAGLGYFNTTAVADNAFISDLFIFAAVALPVLAGSENPLTEQTVPFGLECSVVDRLRLCYLASGPLTNLLRGRKSDLDRIKRHRLINFVFCFRHLGTPLHIFDSAYSSSKDSSNPSSAASSV